MPLQDLRDKNYATDKNVRELTSVVACRRCVVSCYVAGRNMGQAIHNSIINYNSYDKQQMRRQIHVMAFLVTILCITRIIVK